jgi:acyl-CoA thioester hydrolase
MQQLVFNANYMAYCDDAVDSWFQSRLGSRNLDFDFMLKNFQITWFSPFRYRDEAVLECRLVRWGNTSLEIRIVGSVGEAGGGAGGGVGGAGGRKVFEATLTYVSVVPGEVKTTPVPDWVKGQIGLAA